MEESHGVETSQGASRPEQMRAANIARGTFGSILLVGPMFSVNIVDSGLVYREQPTGGRRSSVEYDAQIM